MITLIKNIARYVGYILIATLVVIFLSWDFF